MTDPRTGSRWILGDKFDQKYPHLESISALWNKKYAQQLPPLPGTFADD